MRQRLNDKWWNLIMQNFVKIAHVLYICRKKVEEEEVKLLHKFLSFLFHYV